MTKEEALQKIKELEVYIAQEDKKEFIKEGQRYWYLGESDVYDCSWNNASVDNCILACANVFLTREEAEKANERRLALGTIQKFIRDNDLEFIPDWKDEKEKWQIEGWNYNDETVYSDRFCHINISQHNLVFQTKEDRKKVLDGCEEELKTLLRK